MFSRNKPHVNFKIYDKNVNIYYFQSIEQTNNNDTGLFRIIIRDKEYKLATTITKELYVNDYDITDVSYDNNILSYRHYKPNHLITVKCVQLNEYEYQKKLSLAPSIMLGKEIEQILKYVPTESSKKIFEELVLKTKGKFINLIRDNKHVVGKVLNYGVQYQAEYKDGIGFTYTHGFIPEVAIKDFINYYVDMCLRVVNQPEIKEFEKIKEILDGIH